MLLDPVKANDALYKTVYSDSDNRSIRRGYEIWHTDMNYYSVLTENCRFTNLSDSVLASFNVGARIGNPDENLMNQINASCYVGDHNELDNRLETKYTAEDRIKTVSLAFTNVEVDKVNEVEFHKLCQKGAQHTTIRARHTTGANNDDVTTDIAESLQNTTSNEYDSAVINLAIGTRCRCTQNLSPQLGKTKTIYVERIYIYFLHNIISILIFLFIKHVRNI